MKPKTAAKLTVAVDVDGVLAAYDGWKGPDHFGEPLPGAAEFLRDLQGFARVLIWTTRANEPASLVALMSWLERHGMVYDAIWTETGKPLAAAFVDDRALNPAYDMGMFWGAILESCRRFCEDGLVNPAEAADDGDDEMLLSIRVGARTTAVDAKPGITGKELAHGLGVVIAEVLATAGEVLPAGREQRARHGAVKLVCEIGIKLLGGNAPITAGFLRSTSTGTQEASEEH